MFRGCRPTCLTAHQLVQTDRGRSLTHHSHSLPPTHTHTETQTKAPSALHLCLPAWLCLSAPGTVDTKARTPSHRHKVVVSTCTELDTAVCCTAFCNLWNGIELCHQQPTKELAQIRCPWSPQLTWLDLATPTNFKDSLKNRQQNTRTTGK